MLLIFSFLLMVQVNVKNPRCEYSQNEKLQKTANYFGDSDKSTNFTFKLTKAYEVDRFSLDGYELELEFPFSKYTGLFLNFGHVAGPDFEYYNMDLDDDGISNETWTQLVIGLNFYTKPILNSRIRFFGKAGMGFEFYDDGYQDDNSVGIGIVNIVGAGIKFRVSKYASLVLEGQTLGYNFFLWGKVYKVNAGVNFNY
jgi:hypothetical protein